MGANLFKLEKLKIKAWKDAQRQEKAASPSEFEAMFNPSSFKQSYGVRWSGRQGIGSSGREAKYQRSEPSTLDLDLVLDGTGVHTVLSPLGPPKGKPVLSPLGGRRPGPPQGTPVPRTRKSVAEQVKVFMDVAWRYNGDIHQPNYLLVEWGTLSLPCCLTSVDVTYDMFDRDGTPLRAELAVRLVADEEAGKRIREEQKASALTHSRIVRAGDTLPLLTKEVYGAADRSADRYLDIARHNGLDNIRSLVPGQKISFPPIDRLHKGTPVLSPLGPPKGTG